MIDMIMDCKSLAEKACKHWFAYQNPVELELALRVAKEFCPKVVVEIGIAYCASLACWAEIARPDLVIGIDPMTLPATEEQKGVIDFLTALYKIHIIKQPSCLPKAHSELEALLGDKKIDFLFIDADHRYDSVRADWDNYLPYMNSPSMVGFHDIYYSDKIFDSGSQVSFLWDRIKRQMKYNRFDEFHYHSSMGIGIVYLP